MPAGADKRISYDPPGAIGLPALDAVVLLRFDEADSAIHPKDDAGSLTDLEAPPGLALPAVGSGVLGGARVLGPGFAMWCTDLVSGNTLLTRDMTIQVVLSADIAAQAALAKPGTIVARGLTTSLAEYVAYGLELVVVDAPSFTWQIRWFWQDVGGTLKTQTGAQFVLSSGFTMLTATRRWVSPTEVMVRYYVGDVLLGEVTSADGSIGGGTTGTFQVGQRFIADFDNFLVGAIDELLILDHEISREEIEATWLRITSYQPLGEQLFRQLHDEGFPQSTDPGSDVQRENRMVGQALGYAAAQVEIMRANFLPGRSSGSVLDQWVEATRAAPQPPQDVDTRRARAVARFRQRRGVSIGGLQDVLQGLLGGGTIDDLEFLAFDNTVNEDFTTMSTLRWDMTPTGSFAAVSGKGHVAPGAGTYLMNGTTRSWRTAAQAVGGNGKQAHVLSKLVFTTPQSVGEAGIYFGEVAAGNFLLLGLRDNAGSFQVVTESFIANVSQGLVVQATPGANPAAIWLHLYQTAVDGVWKAAWSTTSGLTGFTTSSNITHPTVAYFGGLYLRSTGAIGAAVADFDDCIVRAPFGTRPFNAYVLLDRALGFTPDLLGGNAAVGAIRHAFTHGAFIDSRSVLCDDATSGCDLGPMGGM